jgi:hypothetical protein
MLTGPTNASLHIWQTTARSSRRNWGYVAEKGSGSSSPAARRG